MADHVSTSLLPVLEATYLLERSEADWLGGILDASWAACPSAVALTAYTFDVSDPGNFRPGPSISRGAGTVPDISALMRAAPTEFVQSTWGTLQVEQTFKYGIPAVGDGLDGALKQFVQANGIRDGVTINGVDGSGRGASVVILFPKIPDVRRFRRSGWTRLATHLATAVRLRRVLSGRGHEAGMEAVLTPSGRVIDAQGVATEKQAREALRGAVRDMEKTRHRRGQATGGPFSSWRALVTARWSLVDSFKLAGTRYIVAQENSPAVRELPSLSRREREVVELAGAGHSNKLIAYALGISASTVGVLLHRAAGKLQAATREELIERYRSGSNMPSTVRT